MNRADLRVGISTGLLAATATAGALIAIGSRTATVARPFNAIAGHLLGVQKSDALGFVAAITIPGILLHVLLTGIAALIVTIIVRRRFVPLWAAALIVSVLSALISVGIARRGGSSLARVLPVGDIVLYYAILAIVVGLGTRLAFFERTPGGRSTDSM